jgi:hypothetical protein
MSCRKVFIVGCPRSGTTWTRSMLCGHPSVIAPANETHVYDELYEPIIARGLDPIARASLLAHYDSRALDDEDGLPVVVGRSELARLLQEAAASTRPLPELADDIIAAILDGFATRSAVTDDNVLVEKTPSHLFHTRRILRRFPEARIVEVVRDGRDVCVSMQYRAMMVSWPPTDRAEQIRQWVEAVQFGMAARSTPDAAGRWHVLQFEAAKDDPRRALAELFTFCGLPFDDALVERVAEATDFSRLEYTGDGRLFRRGEVGAWRTEFDDADRALFTRLARETLTAAGYDL